MIKISKEAAHKLNKEFKIRFGENGISHTKNSHHRTYYLCESENNLRALLSFSSDEKAQKLLDQIDAKKRRYNNYNKKNK